MAADGDVGIELPRSVREALAILAVDQRAPARHQQRAGLEQVARRIVGKLLAARDADAAVDVHASALGPPRRGDRLVADDRAVHPHLAQRAIRVAQEEPRDERLGLVVGGAPVIEAPRLSEHHHPQGRRGKRVPGEVDGGVQPVAQADAGELVCDVVGHGGYDRSALSSARGFHHSAALVEVDGDQIGQQIPPELALPKPTAQEAIADLLVASDRRRERRDPVVYEKQRAVGVAAIAPAAKLGRRARAERCVLHEGECRQVPGARPAIQLGQDDETGVGPKQLAERRKRLVGAQSSRLGEQLGVLQPALDHVHRYVGFHDQDDHLARIGFQKAAKELELLVERLRAELAQRVTEVGAAGPVDLAHSHVAGQPFRGTKCLRAQLL